MAKPSSVATPSTDVNGTISPDSVTGRKYNNHIKTLEDVYKRQAASSSSALPVESPCLDSIE